MSENNKSYRIRTHVGSEYNGGINLDVNLLQNYDMFEILSLKINTENLYKYHTSKYGCIVGRVLANGGVGVPNAKISVFVPLDDLDSTDPIYTYLYPYVSTRDKNRDNIRYNLLTDQKIDDCHQNVGTFPNKRLVLDDNNVIEIFDKYYKYTTTTNGSGDYMIFGIPVGNNILHSDLDLSDIGILSQKPRDLFYKGYTARQFENASQFKKDNNIDNLTQVISQDSSVYVFPFWGDEIENEGQIKIVRNDIDVDYKFEPTCIFIGSIVSDEKSHAISKNCIPHERMGKMDRLTTGNGTIEMIRKTMSGDVESFSIQGNELIDGNGTWCYQIPMNLDYMATDEYGNLVPTDDYEKGIPTRTCVRFRVSLADYESDSENAHLVKVLVPNNPNQSTTDGTINYDYQFGTQTKDESYRNLFWNNVYTVKQYIPRFQKGNRQRNKNFTGFKAVNVNGANNPIPYNNMRINLTFLFVFQCLIFKSMIMIVKLLNKLIYLFDKFNSSSSTKDMVGSSLVYITLDGGMCPGLDGNYIAPGAKKPDTTKKSNIVINTYHSITGEELKDDSTFKIDMSGTSGTTRPYDKQSSDNKNGNYGSDNKSSKEYENEDGKTENIKIYNTEDYFVKCVELQFAMEYEVIQFDFYNDWINGMLYIPRWFAEIKKNKDNMYYCGETFSKNRNLVQQCAVGYDSNGVINSDLGCKDNNKYKKQECHKKGGRKVIKIFKNNKGIVKNVKTSKGHNVYYLRPSELISDDKTNNGVIKANLFSTDMVLLGSVLDCNQYGIPKVKGYTSSSYLMPPPVAQIVSDNQEMEFKNTPLGVDSIEGCDKVYKESLVKVLKPYVNNLKNNEKIGEKNRELLDKALSDPLNWKKYFSEVENSINSSWLASTTICSATLGTDIAACIAAGILGKLLDEIREYMSEIETADEELKSERAYCRSQFSGSEGSSGLAQIFYAFTKSIRGSSLDDDGETLSTEISGIDWGYNPFKVGDKDNAKALSNEVAGHFLEIGCTFSLSNVKSCVNLQRICEIGTEMSQSHYYKNNNQWKMFESTGIISKREVSDGGIRSTFSTLNSNQLNIVTDTDNNYKKYNFKPYSPISFMGELNNIDGVQLFKNDTYGLIESVSESYKRFRFAVTNSDITKKFLLKENSKYYMPQFENSFYFYFGLKNGSTAIDRLYTEYYSECANDDDEVSTE